MPMNSNPSAHAPRKSRSWGNILKPLALLALILLGWHFAARAQIWSSYVLPSPEKVWNTLWQMLRDGSALRDILVSLRRVAIGYGIAFGLAFFLGLGFAYSRNLTQWLGPFLEFFRNVPPIALIALLILWFGIGEVPKIVIIVLASFFPMFLNIRRGFEQADEKLIEVGRSLGFSRSKLFFCIVLPCAAGDVLVGMRIGLGYSYRAIIGAEMIAAASGLGRMIVYAQQMSRSDKVIIGILLIGLIGCATDWLFSLGLRWFSRRRGETLG